MPIVILLVTKKVLLFYLLRNPPPFLCKSHLSSSKPGFILLVLFYFWTFPCLLPTACSRQHNFFPPGGLTALTSEHISICLNMLFARAKLLDPDRGQFGEQPAVLSLASLPSSLLGF